MKKIAFATALLFSVLAWASLKTWSNGETVRASDLNGNFSTLNTTKVGGGVLLVNSDVSSSAAISHSKMATPSLLPKAWAEIGVPGTACGSSPCTVTVSAGGQISGVTRTSTGIYVVTFTARANISYAPIITSMTDSVFCSVSAVLTTTTTTLTCRLHDNTVTDAAFTFMLLDDA